MAHQESPWAVGFYSAKDGERSLSVYGDSFLFFLLLTIWNKVIYFLTCLFSTSFIKQKVHEGGNFFYLIHFSNLVPVRALVTK